MKVIDNVLLIPMLLLENGFVSYLVLAVFGKTGMVFLVLPKNINYANYRITQIHHPIAISFSKCGRCAVDSFEIVLGNWFVRKAF